MTDPATSPVEHRHLDDASGTLVDLRRLAAQVVATRPSDEVSPELELARGFLDLDGHLCSHGYLPEVWADALDPFGDHDPEDCQPCAAIARAAEPAGGLLDTDEPQPDEVPCPHPHGHVLGNEDGLRYCPDCGDVEVADSHEVADAALTSQRPDLSAAADRLSWSGGEGLIITPPPERDDRVNEAFEGWGPGR